MKKEIAKKMMDKGKIPVKINNVDVHREFLNKNWDYISLRNNQTGDTARLDVLEIFPKRKNNKSPFFKGRWDHEKDEIDIDIFNVNKKDENYWKRERNGYKGHHTELIKKDSNGACFKANVEIPNEKIFNGEILISSLQHEIKYTAGLSIAKGEVVVVEKIDMTDEQKMKLEKIWQKTIFYNDLPTPEQALERLKEANIAIIDWTDINPILDKLEYMRLIQLMSTAYDFVDIKKAKERGIKIANIPEYATEAVAEHVFGLMLSIIKKIPKADKDIRNGKWEKEPFRGWELKNKTLGTVGLGHIGTRVSEIAQGFGMKVIAYDINPKNIKNIEMVKLDELFKRSDVVTVHCDLNEKSKNLITKKQFDLMKPTAIFIDASASGITNIDDLVKTLEKKKIYGAGIDILPENTTEHPLLKLENVIVTPHIAFNTNESIERRVDVAIDNIESFIRKGKPKNIVNE